MTNNKLNNTIPEGLKDIPGYEGLYAATRDGKIFSYRRNNFLKPAVGPFGYLIVSLHKNGKTQTRTVHRLIALTYIPNPLGLSDVNHISEIKSDCSVDNLEWMSHKDNCNYGTRNRRLSKKVYCKELNKLYASLKAASIDLGLDVGNINRACRGIYKTTGGYHWSYV